MRRAASELRIALLPFAAPERVGGVGRYVRELHRRVGGVDGVTVEVFVTSGSGRYGRLGTWAARRRPLSGLDRFDVGHVPVERLPRSVPLDAAPLVVTIHGLGGVLGDDSDPAARRADRAFAARLASVGDRCVVITPTVATRDRLCDRLDLDVDRVLVVPHGIDHEVFHACGPVAPVDVVGDAPYVLHVGPLTRRKNTEALFAAVRELRRAGSPLRLVVVGRSSRRHVEEAAVRHGLDGAVVVAGPLADADLAAVYRGAAAVCVPSRYEGFGLPVLEAMACGAPVIVSPSPSLLEVGGDAVAVVEEVDDPVALAGALRQIVESPEHADAMRRRGIARAAQFSWQQSAERHLEIYRGAREDASRPGGGRR